MPTFIVGYLFESFFKDLNSQIVVVIAMLFSIGAIMIFSDKIFKEREKDSLPDITNKDAGLIGLAQVVALIPGTSRSGITILFGNYRHLTSSNAAEFSFMLAIPTILGAIIHSMVSGGSVVFLREFGGLFLLGNLVSFVSGLAAVSFMMRILKKHGLKGFGYYRVGLALVLICLVFATIIPV